MGAAATYLLLQQRDSASRRPPIVGSAATEPQAPQRQHQDAQAVQPASSVRNFLQDEVLVEQLTRNVQFFGEEAQQTIANSFVIVVGLGVSCDGGIAGVFRSLVGPEWLQRGKSLSLTHPLMMNSCCVAGGRQPCSTLAAALRRGQTAAHRL